MLLCGIFWGEESMEKRDGLMHDCLPNVAPAKYLKL
jgi:hypothetical protein